MADIYEDFEDTSYAFPISTNSWIRSSTASNSGSWSLRSPLSPAGSGVYNADITIPAGSISVVVHYKVLSEGGFDFFRIFVDGVQVKEASGSVEWISSGVINVTGKSTLRVQYSKDPEVSTPPDAAWVDDITFSTAPPSTIRGWGPVPVF